MRVSTIKGGRRVEGMFARGDTAARTFECDVAPDPSDTLRGLRVTRLELGSPAPGAG